MQRISLLARQVLRWSAYLALPGILWAAFEMYGLTMSGEQMLFFSIAHTMPPLVLVVWLAVPAGAIWLAQAVVALGSSGYRSLVQLNTVAATIFVSALSLQAVLLATYEEWASSPLLRFPLCVLGLALTALLVRESWRSHRLSPGGRTTSVPAGDA